MKSTATIAALDIGSNSFQLIVARQISGRLEILHKEKLKVHLAEGLDAAGNLSDDAIVRAETALKEFATTLQGFNANHVKIVATYTVRKAKNKYHFIQRAKKIIPFNIDVISGLEEARLIYQGVANYRVDNDTRLVIDIGGGSTEFIVGKGPNTHQLASRSMGCVTFQQMFFADNTISHDSFNRAIVAASQEIEPILNAYQNTNWQCAIGTSGSFKAILSIVQHTLINDSEHDQMTLSDLNVIKHKLISFGDIKHIELPGLSEERKGIICSAVAIAIACFELLNIKSLTYCDFSLREGVLHELIDCSDNHNLKQQSIDSFAQRFDCDKSQSSRVKAMLTWLFEHANKDWNVNLQLQKIVFFAADVYEVGLSISSSNIRKHSAYIIANSLLPGFSQEEQQLLTLLVRNHRKKLKLESEQLESNTDFKEFMQAISIFRLALLFTQKRQCDFVKIDQIRFLEHSIDVTFEQNWWQEQPLLQADFEKEAMLLEPHGINLNCINR